MDRKAYQEIEVSVACSCLEKVTVRMENKTTKSTRCNNCGKIHRFFVKHDEHESKAPNCS